MRRSAMGWLSSLLLFVGIAGLIAGWQAASTHWWAADDNAHMAVSGSAATLTLAKGSYAIWERQTRPVDSCAVTDANGNSLPVTTLHGKPGSDNYQQAFRFTTRAAGQYTITCRAKSDGRDIRIAPTAAPLDLLTNPLAWAGAVALIAGLVLSFRATHRRQARTNPTNTFPGAGAPPGGQYPGQYPGQQFPGQFPGQYPGQYPGQNPGQYPGQYPGQAVYPPAGGYPPGYGAAPGQAQPGYPAQPGSAGGPGYGLPPR